VRELGGTRLIDGRIHANGTPQGRGQWPLIFQDDIKVALALAFANEAGPSTPTFSLDRVEARSAGAKYDSILQRKVFDPEWLGTTDFGRSLFWSDYLMQQLVGIEGMPMQSLTDHTRTRRQQKAEDPGSSWEWLSKLLATEGPETPKDSLGSRMCIKLRRLSVTISPDKTEIILRSGGCYLEASYIRPASNGKHNYAYRLNDTATQAGATAANVNVGWKRLSRIFPVFARLEQLLTLYKILEHGRQLGWRLSPNELELTKKFVTARPKLDPRTTVVPMPYHKSGCQCCGAWPEPAPITCGDLWA
jgi:hypothetical protein